MKHLEILLISMKNLLRHPSRTTIVVFCLVVILTPFITALAMLEGVRGDALVSVEEGADLYVTMDMYGRNGIIPQEVADEIESIDGVRKAVPRVISRIYVEGKLAVLLGLPREEIQTAGKIMEGALPSEGEVVVGRGLAQALQLKVGSNLSLGVRVIAIVQHSPQIMKRVFRVSGIFHPDTSIWSSDLILISLQDAIDIYEMEGFVSDIAVFVEPGRVTEVAEKIQQMNAYFRIQSKSLTRQYVKRAYSRKGGVFTLLYIFALVLAIPVMALVSGVGLRERKREVGILKATGWSTEEVLQMVLYENCIIALLASSISVLTSYIWLKVLNGAFLIQVFIAEITHIAPFRIPSRFGFDTMFLALTVCLGVTLVGSLYTTWRTAVTPPQEVLR